jgi:FMNH2-dependent dimethyl sulfone monooxygenase
VSAACVAATQRIRVITAVQPGFKAPGVVAKMGATLSQFRPEGFGLSLLAGWWQLEVENYDDVWLPHAERYIGAAEFLDVVTATGASPRSTSRASTSRPGAGCSSQSRSRRP